MKKRLLVLALIFTMVLSQANIKASNENDNPTGNVPVVNEVLKDPATPEEPVVEEAPAREVQENGAPEEQAVHEPDLSIRFKDLVHDPLDPADDFINPSIFPFTTYLELEDLAGNVTRDLVTGQTYVTAIRFAMPTGFDLNKDLIIKAGDFFILDIPMYENIGFDIGTNAGGILHDETGAEMATFKLTQKPEGGFGIEVKFTSDNAQKNINGEMKIKGNFTAGKDLNSGDTVVKHPFHEDQTITITNESKHKGEIDKVGKRDPQNSEQFLWEVSINRQNRNLKNVVLNDFPSTGQKIESVKIYEATYDNTGALIAKGADVTNKFDVTDPKTINFGNIGQAYIVEYVTSFDYNAHRPSDSNTTEVKFNNRAELTFGDNQKDDSTAEVIVSYEKRIDKKAGTYNREDRTLGWTVVYNPAKEVLKNVVLVDTIPKNTSLVLESMKIVSIDGNTTLANPGDYTIREYTVDGVKKFDIIFKDTVNDGYNITYKTKLDANFEIDSSHTFTNVIVDGSYNGSAGITVGQGNIIKDTPTVDHTAKTADWQIRINTDKREMKDANIVDKFLQPGLTLIDGTLKVYDGDKPVARTDYKVNVLDVVKNPYSGFDITLIGAYATTSKSLTIKYSTDFDANVFAEFYANHPAPKPTDRWLGNTATITFSGGRTSNSTNGFKITEIEKTNGKKVGKYDATTKTLTWDVYANVNNNPLKDAEIVDTLPVGVTYVDNSVKYKFFTIAKNGNIVDGAQLTDADIAKHIKSFTKSIFVDEKGKSHDVITVKFVDNTEEGTQIKVTFDSLITEQLVQKEYKNDVKFTNNGKDYFTSNTVKIPHGGQVVNKSGKDDSGIINWNVNLNFSQSVISDFVIEDTMTPNQILLKDTIKLYATTVNAAGVVTRVGEPLASEGLYTITHDNPNSSFKLTFNDKVDKSYVLVYQSMVDLASITGDAVVSNSLKISGNSETTIPNSGENGDSIAYSSSSGTITGTLSKIKFMKVDQFGKPVVGAEFKLTSQRTSDFTREAVSDALGVVEFDNVPKGLYKIEETGVPTGYTGSILGDKAVIMDTVKNNDPNNVTVYNYNHAVKVEKVDGANKALDGAVFTLTAVSDATFVPRTATTVNGVATFDKLPLGTYKLVETQAPDGYIRDTKVHEFEIVPFTNWEIVNGRPVLNEAVYDHVIKATNYQGILEFNKINEDVAKAPLQGAEFTLFDADDKAAYTAISDANGRVKFNGVKPGTYTLKETVAPEGFVLSNRTETIVIAGDNLGAPVSPEVADFINYKGLVTLKKLNAHGDLLNGAVFELYDAQDNIVPFEAVFVNGVLTIDDLVPGAYYFKEVSAPEGYILDETKIPFVIAANHDGKETIALSHVNHKGSIAFVKVNGDVVEGNNVLKGAEFALLDSEGKETSYTAISDENGLVEFKDVSPGTYTIIETKAPNGFIINTEDFGDVVIPEAHVGEFYISLEGTFANYQGQLLVTKIDKFEEPLAGAEFTLVSDKGVTYVGVSDDNGEIVFDKLAPGEYTLTETKAPKGYIRDERVHTFTVADRAVGNDVNYGYTHVNYKGSVLLTKVGVHNVTLEGAEFTLTGGDLLEPKVFITDDKGQIFIEELSVGEYTLTETKAPKGYVLKTKTINFEIVESSNEDITPVLIDVVNELGSVQLLKVNEKNEVLKGAEFELFMGDVSLGKFVTAEDGTIKVENLEVGTYHFVETKAPQGYLLNTDKIEFEVEASVETLVEMDAVQSINYQGSLEITKVNPKGKVLDGAEFNILDSSGKLVQTVVAEKGRVLVEGLAPGKYVLVETKAPKGHVLPKEGIEFTIADEAAGKPEAVKLDVVNKEIEILPETGVSSKLLPSVMVTLLGFAIIQVSSFRKLRKRKQS